MSDLTHIGTVALTWQRPKGGHKLHARPWTERRALCGFEPSSPDTSKMKPRHGWASDAASWAKRCDACVAKARQS